MFVDMMLAVLSPAKAMDMSATSCTLRSKPAMEITTEALLPVVQKLTVNEVKQKMELSDNLAVLNADRYGNFQSQETKQACLAFDGPAYRGLEAKDFCDVEQLICQAKIRLLSGLYGVLRPYDEIRPYRLCMGTNLVTQRGKTLYEFWGDEITEQLGKELGVSGPRIVVNCASEEYWKAVRCSKLPSGVQVITCDFPGPGVYAKKARGLMCRHIVKANVSDVQGLKMFKGCDGDRYEFCPVKSTESRLVFLRVKSAATAKAKVKAAAKLKADASSKAAAKPLVQISALKRPAAAPLCAVLKRRVTAQGGGV